MRKIRARHIYSFLGTFLAIALLVVTDPDFGVVQHLSIGAGTITSLVFLMKGIMGITLLNISRKFVIDYAISDMEALGEVAASTPIGAAIYAVALSIMTLAFAVVMIGVMFV